MKRILLLILCVFVLGFQACLNVEKVDSLTMIHSLNKEGTVTNEFLKLTPDYQTRTVAIVLQNDGQEYEGSVGGEFFDRFQNVINYVSKKKLISDKELSGDLLKLSLVKLDEKEEILTVNWEKADEKIEYIEEFYSDVVDLLSSEVPV